MDELTQELRDLSYALKGLGTLFSGPNSEEPFDPDTYEGVGCILKCLGEKAYGIAWNMDGHAIKDHKEENEGCG